MNPPVPSNLARALLVDETKETACIFVVTSAVPSKEDLVAPLNWIIYLKGVGVTIGFIPPAVLVLPIYNLLLLEFPETSLDKYKAPCIDVFYAIYSSVTGSPYKKYTFGIILSFFIITKIIY